MQPLLVVGPHVEASACASLCGLLAGAAQQHGSVSEGEIDFETVSEDEHVRLAPCARGSSLVHKSTDYGLTKGISESYLETNGGD